MNDLSFNSSSLRTFVAVAEGYNRELFTPGRFPEGIIYIALYRRKTCNYENPVYSVHWILHLSWVYFVSFFQFPCTNNLCHTYVVFPYFYLSESP